MVDINGIVLRKDDFSDLTLKLKKYDPYRIMATIKLDHEIPGVGKKITNVLYETNDKAEAKRAYEMIKYNLEKGGYKLKIGKAKNEWNGIILGPDNDYFELKIFHSLYKMLKGERKKIKKAFGEEYNRKVEDYKFLEQKIIDYNIIEQEFLDVYNRAFNYHTTHDFFPKSF